MLIVQLADLNQATIDFSILSSQVIEQANKLNVDHKKQFLVCRSLLARLLKDNWGEQVLPPIMIGENSRPCFIDKHLPDFNISHSKHMVAVAISSKQHVGVDIEFARNRKNYLTVAKHFFSECENTWLHKQPDSLEAFWQLWTLKESALKLYSKGVWQMKSVNIDVEHKVISAPFAKAFYFQYHRIKNVHISISSDKPIDNLVLIPH